MTREQLEREDKALADMITECDKMIASLGVCKAQWRWVDRRSALVLAIQALQPWADDKAA